MTPFVPFEQLAATGALDESKVTPGTLGFLVVVALGIALWLLVRSMSNQMRKIDFDERDTERPDSGKADGGHHPARQ
jgi:hypothetical protein